MCMHACISSRYDDGSNLAHRPILLAAALLAVAISIVFQYCLCLTRPTHHHLASSYCQVKFVRGIEQTAMLHAGQELHCYCACGVAPDERNAARRVDLHAQRKNDNDTISALLLV